MKRNSQQKQNPLKQSSVQNSVNSIEEIFKNHEPEEQNSILRILLENASSRSYVALENANNNKDRAYNSSNTLMSLSHIVEETFKQLDKQKSLQ